MQLSITARARDKPQQNECPSRETLWFSYNHAIAKSQKPKPYRTEVHTPLNLSLAQKGKANVSKISKW
jgi:hypothetical protein